MKCGEIWARRKRSSNCTARRRERSSSASCSWVETNSATSPLSRSRLAGAEESSGDDRPDHAVVRRDGHDDAALERARARVLARQVVGGEDLGPAARDGHLHGASTSSQCAASMPSAASIPKVSAMATPAVPIKLAEVGDRSLRRALVEAGPQRRGQPGSPCGGWPAPRAASACRAAARSARRSGSRSTITITTPTRAIHSASFIGPLPPWRAPPTVHCVLSAVCHIAPPEIGVVGLTVRQRDLACRSSHGDDRSSHECVTSPTTHCSGGGRLRTMTSSHLSGGREEGDTRFGGRHRGGCSCARPSCRPPITWGAVALHAEQGGADVMAIKDDTVQDGPAQPGVHNGTPACR